MRPLTKRPCTADDDERYWHKRRAVISREMEFQNLFLLYLRNEFGDSEIKPLPTVRERKLQKANAKLEKLEREGPIFLWLLATVIGAAVAAVVIVVSVLLT